MTGKTKSMTICSCRVKCEKCAAPLLKRQERDWEVEDLPSGHWRHKPIEMIHASSPFEGIFITEKQFSVPDRFHFYFFICLENGECKDQVEMTRAKPWKRDIVFNLSDLSVECIKSTNALCLTLYFNRIGAAPLFVKAG